jgi:hypothetical protein
MFRRFLLTLVNVNRREMNPPIYAKAQEYIVYRRRFDYTVPGIET